MDQAICSGLGSPSPYTTGNVSASRLKECHPLPDKARFHALFITLGFVGFSCGPVLITFFGSNSIAFAFSPEVVRALGELPPMLLSERQDFSLLSALWI